jgi:hypothetical protein
MDFSIVDNMVEKREAEYYDKLAKNKKQHPIIVEAAKLRSKQIRHVQNMNERKNWVGYEKIRDAPNQQEWIKEIANILMEDMAKLFERTERIMLERFNRMHDLKCEGKITVKEFRNMTNF